jgi:hypothetical protein
VSCTSGAYAGLRMELVPVASTKQQQRAVSFLDGSSSLDCSRMEQVAPLIQRALYAAIVRLWRKGRGFKEARSLTRRVHTLRRTVLAVDKGEHIRSEESRGRRRTMG